MCALNTCTVVRIQISKLSCLGKLLPLSCKLHSQKRSVVWRFSVNLVYSMPIPYCDEAHTACSMCLKLSLSPMQSLISVRSFRKPSPPSIFRTYCQWQKGKQELANMSTHSVLSVNQNSTDIWSQLRSDLRAIFLLQACLACVSTTALCYTQSAIITSQATVEILFADSCRTWDLWSIKMASSDLLASNLTKFWGSMPQEPSAYYLQYVDFDHTTLNLLATGL